MESLSTQTSGLTPCASPNTWPFDNFRHYCLRSGTKWIVQKFHNETIFWNYEQSLRICRHITTNSSVVPANLWTWRQHVIESEREYSKNVDSYAGWISECKQNTELKIRNGVHGNDPNFSDLDIIPAVGLWCTSVFYPFTLIFLPRLNLQLTCIDKIRASSFLCVVWKLERTDWSVQSTSKVRKKDHHFPNSMEFCCGIGGHSCCNIDWGSARYYGDGVRISFASTDIHVSDVSCIRRMQFVKRLDETGVASCIPTLGIWQLQIVDW